MSSGEILSIVSLVISICVLIGCVVGGFGL